MIPFFKGYLLSESSVFLSLRYRFLYPGIENCALEKVGSILVSSITKTSIFLETISSRDENLYLNELTSELAKTTLQLFLSISRYQSLYVFV